jgi:lipoyl synthase
MRPRLPSWFRRPLPPGAEGGRVKRLLGRLALHTVCEGAQCPNRATCWHEGAAAFLILGDACTRDCRFCAIPHDARPAPPDPGEPARLAEAAAAMGLRHVVVTSVTRDDLPDGGAGHFAATIRAIRARLPAPTVEVLVPDFQGDPAAIDSCSPPTRHLQPQPRNRGTPPAGSPPAGRLPPLARRPAPCAAQAGARVKSGLMLGMGETDAELAPPCATCAPPASPS